MDHRAVENFYTRDGKGRIITRDFLGKENRETIRRTLVGYTVALMGAAVGFFRYLFDPSRITAIKKKHTKQTEAPKPV